MLRRSSAGRVSDCSPGMRRQPRDWEFSRTVRLCVTADQYALSIPVCQACNTTYCGSVLGQTQDSRYRSTSIVVLVCFGAWVLGCQSAYEPKHLRHRRSAEWQVGGQRLASRGAQAGLLVGCVFFPQVAKRKRSPHKTASEVPRWHSTLPSKFLRISAGEKRTLPFACSAVQVRGQPSTYFPAS